MSLNKKRKLNISLLVPFLVMALVFGLLILEKYRASRELPVSPPERVESGIQKIVLFFMGEGPRLVREARDIDSCGDQDNCLKTVLDELFSGPVGEYDVTIPEGAVVLSARIVGEVAQVDLSSEFAEEMPSGSSSEMLAVYSIVDTVCINFLQVRRVLITIEGMEKAVLRHLDLSDPLEPDYSLEEMIRTEEVPSNSIRKVK